jgi:hypothetical protein
MRPHSEVRQALLGAVQVLATPTQAPTLAELAAHAQVGREHARCMVAALKRHGALQIARTRRVPYRNRPVAEYQLAVAQAANDDEGDGFVDLGRLLNVWSAAA